MLLSLDRLVIDTALQARAATYENVVEDYAAAMRGGVSLPPVTVFSDGKTYWLSDGFHRVAAARAIGRTDIEVTVYPGDRRVAILHSAACNADHGLRRTREDKRRAVLMLLGDAEWGCWSDREIGRHCKVDGKTVATIRASLRNSAVSGGPELRTFKTRHGTVAQMDTGAIGGRRAREPFKFQLGEDAQLVADGKVTVAGQMLWLACCHELDQMDESQRRAHISDFESLGNDENTRWLVAYMTERWLSKAAG